MRNGKSWRLPNMKAIIWTLLLVTVIAGVGALGTGMGTTYAHLFPIFLLIAIVAGLLFLILAARNGRLERR